MVSRIQESEKTSPIIMVIQNWISLKNIKPTEKPRFFKTWNRKPNQLEKNDKKAKIETDLKTVSYARQEFGLQLYNINPF
jgi:hypothetical protein